MNLEIEINNSSFGREYNIFIIIKKNIYLVCKRLNG